MNIRQKRILAIMALVASVFVAMSISFPVIFAAEASVKSASDWSYEDILSVYVLRDGETIGVERTGDDGALIWAGDAQFDLDADRAVALVNNSRYLSAVEYIGNGEPLSAYGLDTPAYSVEVQRKSGVTVFDFGHENVERTGRFAVERGTDDVFIAASFADRIFSLNKTDYYNRKPAQVNYDSLLEVSVSVKGQASFTISRASTAEPMMIRVPTVGYVNNTAIEDLAPRLLRFSFSELVCFVNTADELLAYGLDDPALTLRLWDGEKAFAIALGNREGNDVYGMRLEAPNAVFRVDYDTVSWLYSQTDFSFVSTYLFYGDERYGEEYPDIMIQLTDASGTRRMDVRDDGEHFTFWMNDEQLDELVAQNIVATLLNLRIFAPCDSEKVGMEAFSIDAQLSGLLVQSCTFYEYDREFYAVDQGFGVYYTVAKPVMQEFLALFE